MLRFLLRLIGWEHLSDLLRSAHADHDEDDDEPKALPEARSPRVPALILPSDETEAPAVEPETDDKRNVNRKFATPESPVINLGNETAVLPPPPRLSVPAGFPDPVLEDGVPDMRPPGILDPDSYPPDAPTPVVAMPILPPEPPAGLRSISAWAESSALRNPKKFVDFAVKAGLTEVIIIANDHSAWRKPKAFTTFNKQRIIAFAKEARAQGLQVGLMTWIMPHREYIKECAKQMTELAEACDAWKVELDAEEPWMLAQLKSGKRISMSAYDVMGDYVHECFGKYGVDRKFKLGVNGIGFASRRKLKTLSAGCDYMTPQCYSTRTQPLEPRTTADRFCQRWLEHFGDREVIVGLAAYRQSKIRILGPDDEPIAAYLKPGGAFQVAVQSCIEDPKIESITFWSLRWLMTRSGRKYLVPVIRKIPRIEDDPVPLAA